jgi:hypothetical protein
MLIRVCARSQLTRPGLVDDEERYKNCDKLPVACPECNHEGLYTGVRRAQWHPITAQGGEQN